MTIAIIDRPKGLKFLKTELSVTDGRTDGRTDGQTDGRTDKPRTHLKSRGLIDLMGQYELSFADDEDGDDGNGDDDINDDDDGHGFEEESWSDTADGRWSLDADGK